MKHHRKMSLNSIPMLGLAVCLAAGAFLASATASPVGFAGRRATREQQARAITPGADATGGASASTALSHSSGEECAQ